MQKTVTSHRTGDGESASMQVVSAVAALCDTTPAELPVLYEAIDPDALDALIERGDDVQIQFEYNGFDIEVTSDTIYVNDSTHCTSRHS
ncbi:HalOD1 output domain-containing protein [Natrialbaceae archaeon A-arb3/5]